MQDLTEIAKSSRYSYYYAESLKFKNVPLTIIKSIAENCSYSYYYAESLKFKNVPLIIIKSEINRYYFKYYPENIYLLLYILQYDKRMNILI